MNGIKIIKASDIPKPKSKSNPFSLVLSQQDMEIIRASICVTDVVWISPADNIDVIEYYYILRGKVILHLETGSVTLTEGDSLSAQNIENDIRLEAINDTELLIFVNNPQYEVIDKYQTLLDEMSLSIDEKDHTTLRHSRKVARYSELIYTNLPEAAAHVRFDELIPAAKYHDVGKIYTPDSILKRVGKLSPDEYEIIKRHASDTREILAKAFGKHIADIAGGHHERLDASGYPDGLKADEIEYGSKIIAVADSFDAMTTLRTYNVKKDALEAAEELVQMSDKYDKTIAETLYRLVESGEIDPDKSESELDIMHDFPSEK